MDTNVILQIVIALVALFWLLSTACSYVVEGINSIFTNLRAQALERFICEMVIGQDKAIHAFVESPGSLSGSPAADPLGILSHGLVTSLRKPQSAPEGEGTPPTYIPANIFSKVLLDRLASLAITLTFDVNKTRAVIAALSSDASLDAAAIKGWKDLGERFDALRASGSGLYAFGQAVVGASTPEETVDAAIARLTLLRKSCSSATAVSQDPEERALGSQMVAILTSACERVGALKDPQKKTWIAKVLDFVLGARTTNVGQSALRSIIEPAALWILVARGVGYGPQSERTLLDALAAVIAEAPLPNSLRESLRPIFANANYDLDMVRAGIESWYDDVMQRASGWFKRNTTWKLFWVGFIAAVAMNVNPFLVVGDLSRDPQLRSAGVDFAQSAVSQGGPIAGQEILFARAAEALKWKKRLDAVPHVSGSQDGASGAQSSNPSSANASSRFAMLQQIAHEIEPLLVRSGSFVGLIPWASNPAKEPDYAKPEREWFLGGVCTAHLQDLSRTHAEVADNKILSQVSPDTARWTDERVCPDLHKQFDTEPVSRIKDKETFWRSSDVVWDQDLGRDLWAALVALEPGANVAAARQDAALTQLSDSLGRAITSSTTTKTKAEDFLDRIPSLGWRALNRASQGCEGRKIAPLTCADTFADFAVNIPLSVGGWLLTALMVSFGAPFWFDLMSKLVNRRVTGPKPSDGET